MMGTCCAAPVVNGLRQCRAASGSTAAYWLGNTILNPATLVFMGFVLGWHLNRMSRRDGSEVAVRSTPADPTPIDYMRRNSISNLKCWAALSQISGGFHRLLQALIRVKRPIQHG